MYQSLIHYKSHQSYQRMYRRNWLVKALLCLGSLSIIINVALACYWKWLSSEQKTIVFALKPLLKRNALSVEIWAQNMVNRYKSRAVAARIVQESSMKEQNCHAPPLPDCPLVPPNLRGPINVAEWLETHKNESGVDMDEETQESSWSPLQCTSRHSVAIIIPYRERKKQLNLLMSYLHPFLKRQQINYKIFVVEQVGNDTFNKGILMNAGFLTALDHPAHGVMYHCFIFHDVDLLPEDDRNMYSCPRNPRHHSVAVDQLDYKLPYYDMVGGVFAVRTEQFLQLNGYSILYWGWGGEDDDMGYRVIDLFRLISRPSEEIARYKMLKHKKRRPMSHKVRHYLLNKWYRNRLDGLNTISYRLVSVVEKAQYAHIMIDVGTKPTIFKRIEEEENNIKIILS